MYVATDHKLLLGTFGDRNLIHVPARKHAGTDALSRNPVSGEALMGDMDAMEVRLSILAGIRIIEDDNDNDNESREMDEIDPALTMAEDKLSCYVCPMLASYGVVVATGKVYSQRVITQQFGDPKGK